MEAIVAIFHSWETWTCEQLDVAKRCIEVEVTRSRRQSLSGCVAKCDLDVVRSTVDIFTDVKEECVIAAPVSSNFHVVNIDVGTLVGVLEPKISWLFSFKHNRCLECESSF